MKEQIDFIDQDQSMLWGTKYSLENMKNTLLARTHGQRRIGQSAGANANRFSIAVKVINNMVLLIGFVQYLSSDLPNFYINISG